MQNGALKYNGERSSLSGWLATSQGSYVLAWELAQFDSAVDDVFGFRAVQIGLPEVDFLRQNRIQFRFTLALEPGAALAADPLQLPLASQSVDLVVLPHVLEFAAEPHQVLREVERVLIPEGQVIICGFNPASLWGIRQGVGRITRSPYLPVAGEFISMPRMKDWLKLLNLGVTRSHFGCYAPPCRTAQWLNRFAFMERSGQRWWPYLGAVYMVHAIKRVKGMTIIGPAWNKKSATSQQAVPATNRK